eukprot:224631-Pyramimonas_sp.AAC.1
MEGGSFSECGQRLSAAHARLNCLQVEGGFFSRCGSRFNTIHNCLRSSNGFHGCKVAPFQNVIIAWAPHTLISNQ